VTRRALYLALTIGSVITTTGLAIQAAPAQTGQPPPPAQGRAQGAKPAATTAEVGILHVQGKVYMINLGDVNVTAQVGDDGILLVDSGPAELADRLIAALGRRFEGKRIRQLVNTHNHADHTGGNAAVVKAAGGSAAAGGGGGGGGGGGRGGLRIIAHETTFNRMSGAIEGEKERSLEERPTSTFFGEKKEIHFNGEPIEILHQPSAHTDGDVMVFFRGSDVISTGGLFATDRYPEIDAPRGGTMQGTLDALNRILDITVPRFNEQGGTRVIPGHGRLCNESDVDDYRNWMTIVKDRIEAMVMKGMTLQQVKAAKPTLDYDTRYGTDTGFWTTAMFVETIYKQMAAANPPAKPSQNRNQNRNQQNQQKGKSE
jgi:cyclase